jgi:hypothetical protein
MTGYTRLILTGRALIGVGAVTELARDLQPAAVTPEDVATAVERTDGTTASFLKELIRRSVLEALHDSAQGVTRTLLGVGVDPTTLPAGGALAMSPARMMAQRRIAVGRAVFRG